MKLKPAAVSVLLLLLLLGSSVDSFGPVPIPTPVINTTLGPVRGTSNGDVWSYRAIPFAKPPLGSLRFRPPQPFDAPWEQVLDCGGAFGPYCTQDSYITGVPDDGSSEDCLTLNVWTPSGARMNQSNVPLPVLAFVFGGGFGYGDTAQPLYDGVNLTRQNDVIVVTMNYRLGALGFLALPELQASETTGEPAFGTPANTTGNAGLQDQRAALAWVKSNIAAFGGDPKKVALWGQSAGAQSVCSHLVLPHSRGYFQRVMADSGCLNTARDPSIDSFPSLKDATKTGDVFAALSGCNRSSIGAGHGASAAVPALVVSCLRAQNTSTLVAAAAKVRARRNSLGLEFGDSIFRPATDGVEWPLRGLALLEQGDWPRMPVMIGRGKEEPGCRGFSTKVKMTINSGTDDEERGYRSLLLKGFTGFLPRGPSAENKFVDRIVSLYPLSEYNTTHARTFYRMGKNGLPVPVMATATYVALLTITSDGSSDLSIHRQAAIIAASGSGDNHSVSQADQTFVWRWDYRPMQNLLTGACHGAELPFAFDNPRWNFDPAFVPFGTGAEARLKREVQGFWVAFARDGKPAESDVWPPFSKQALAVVSAPTSNATSNATSTMSLDAPASRARVGLMDEKCALWNSLPQLPRISELSSRFSKADWLTG